MSEIRAAFSSILNRMGRLVALAWRATAYLFHHGFRAFIKKVKARARRLLEPDADDNTPPSAPNVFEEVYRSLVSASASDREEPEYVPLSDSESVGGDATVKLVAFYLPQFHPIAQNDEWWGKGFTEWTNVSKAVPQFIGHYQPHLPGELGFYDLRVPQAQKRQVELARKYGIYGFAFYYYWFNGKRLLAAPIDRFFSDKAAGFPFCIFWANENWTRRWDGKEQDVLIAQEHTSGSDIAFIRDVEHFLRDERYIRIDGKPVLMVYRVQLLPDPKETARVWREYCRQAGLGEIYLIAGQTYDFEDPRPAAFDAAMEFPPHNAKIARIDDSVTILNRSYAGQIFDYRDLARFYLEKPDQLPYPLYKTVSPAWDNEPRKPGAGSTFAFSSPSAYQEWLAGACALALRAESEKRFVFINAWNEWAEGAYLEPDRRFGYAYLQATAKALNQIRQAPDAIPKRPSAMGAAKKDLSNVFIIGCPRSGTSALSWALAEHPDLWTSVETNLFLYLFQSSWFREQYERTIASREDKRNIWFVHNNVSYAEFAAYIGKGVDLLFRSRSGDRIWIDATPSYTYIASQLCVFFPQAKFIHIIRDGRAVVNSMLLSGFPGEEFHDFRRACEAWVFYITQGLELKRAFPDRVHEIRHESLVADPDEQFRLLYEFLGLEPCAESATFIRTKRINSSYLNTRKDDIQNKIKDPALMPRAPWRSWTSQQQHWFEEIAGETMIMLGYDLVFE